MTILSVEEVQELTGYKLAPKQLAELHRMGFWRARRSPVTGRVILERPHSEAVNADQGKRFDYTRIIPPEKPYQYGSGGRRAQAMAERTPKWADHGAIDAVYAEARRLTAESGVLHHVDHEVPLLGRLVSGLHVANNLRVMVGDDNVRKGNRYEP